MNRTEKASPSSWVGKLEKRCAKMNILSTVLSVMEKAEQRDVLGSGSGGAWELEVVI